MVAVLKVVSKEEFEKWYGQPMDSANKVSLNKSF
jgi:heme/copper-type cytochrome/quinol oxidase subunit 2